MNHDYDVALTKEDLNILVYDEVCDKYGYDKLDIKSLLKDNIQFQQRVSDHLLPHLRGKLTPLGKSRVATYGEAERCFTKSLFFGAYPKRLTTDTDRLKHLKNLYKTNCIKEDMYMDFAKVLKVDFDDIIEALEVCEFA